MMLDKLAYRGLMSRFPTGVAVVLTRSGEEEEGLTVNSLTSVSLNPVLLLFCIGNESRSLKLLTRAGKFTVSLLGTAQESHARYFAGDRIGRPSPMLTRSGDFVWLANANAIFRCETAELIPAGDHFIVLGRVTDMCGPAKSAQPLTYFEKRYGTLLDAKQHGMQPEYLNGAASSSAVRDRR